MKGLLHSKRFRNNLRKWLCMYVGVMLLLTTVVTYSKFISKMNVSDEARAVQFDVNIKSDTECVKDDSNENTNSNEKNCDIGNRYYGNDLDYFFTVDTTKLEVQTFIIFNIDVNASFQINNLYHLNNATDKTGKAMSLSDVAEENVPKENLSDCTTMGYKNTKNGKNRITVGCTIAAGAGTEEKYRINLKYNSASGTPLNRLVSYSELVKVGYSAEQLTK